MLSSFVHGLKTQLSDQEVSGLAKDEWCCKELVWEWGEEEGDVHDYGYFHESMSSLRF